MPSQVLGSSSYKTYLAPGSSQSKMMKTLVPEVEVAGIQRMHAPEVVARQRAVPARPSRTNGLLGEGEGANFVSQSLPTGKGSQPEDSNTAQPVPDCSTGLPGQTPRQRRHWSRATMQHALDGSYGGLTFREAAERYGIPMSTIHGWHSGKVRGDRDCGTGLTQEEEDALAAWVVSCRVELRWQVPKEVLLCKVYEICKDGRKTPFRYGMPGKRWCEDFLRRHPHILKYMRKSKLSVLYENRARAENQEQMVMNCDKSSSSESGGVSGEVSVIDLSESNDDDAHVTQADLSSCDRPEGCCDSPDSPVTAQIPAQVATRKTWHIVHVRLQKSFGYDFRPRLRVARRAYSI